MRPAVLAQACARAIAANHELRGFLEVERVEVLVLGAITRALEDRDRERVGDVGCPTAAWIDDWSARHPFWDRIDTLDDWATALGRETEPAR